MKVKNKLKKNRTTIINKINLNDIKDKSDITVSAIPGIAGLSPTITMIKKSKKLLIANKSQLFVGGN